MSGGRVLVVDDDALILTVLQKALKDKGYKVNTETGARDLLAKVRSWAPDVVLLDVNLPGKTGIEILEEIKEKGIDTEIVMLTADDTADTAIKAMKLGAVDYLTKPFDVDEVGHRHRQDH
jgi:two-component system, NtrC family, response regulator AtoC